MPSERVTTTRVTPAWPIRCASAAASSLGKARGGLIIIGITEDSQGCAHSLSEVAVSDKKIGQMYNGLRAAGR